MNSTLSFNQAASDVGRTAALLRSLPFDVAREQYAKAVRVGLIEPSMLAGAKFERMLSSMELVTLGPWARRV